MIFRKPGHTGSGSLSAAVGCDRGQSLSQRSGECPGEGIHQRYLLQGLSEGRNGYREKTGERIGITLALLACVGFSAFLIWLQQSQENDRQQLTQQVQDSGQREEQTEGSGQIEIRSRVTRSKTGDQPVFPCREGFIRRILR